MQTGTASSNRAAPSRCLATLSELAPAAARASAARLWICCRRGSTISSAIASCVSACRQRYVAPRSDAFAGCAGAARFDLLEQLLGDADRERALDRRLVHGSDRDERPVVERPAEHGRGLERLRLGLVEPLEPQQDRVAHRRGDAQLVELALLPALARAEDVAAVDRLLQHLLEHERVPVRPRVHEVPEAGIDRSVVEDRADHLGDLAALER